MITLSPGASEAHVAQHVPFLPCGCEATYTVTVTWRAVPALYQPVGGSETVKQLRLQPAGTLLLDARWCAALAAPGGGRRATTADRRASPVLRGTRGEWTRAHIARQNGALTAHLVTFSGQYQRVQSVPMGPGAATETLPEQLPCRSQRVSSCARSAATAHSRMRNLTLQHTGAARWSSMRSSRSRTSRTRRSPSVGAWHARARVDP